MTYGYTKIVDMDWFGIEHFIGVHDMIDIINSGRGVGHILDFKHQVYRNVVIMNITDNK